MLHANTIEDVLTGLDEIIASAHVDESRIGYFACLYRLVTLAVKHGVDEREFEDPDRMHDLDVAFANRYFEAINRHLQGEPPTRSWQVAFEAADRIRPIVLQHLLVAMNAHINLDLGIAAARTCPGDKLQPLYNDFEKVNGILASLISKVERELTHIWPVLHILHALMRGEDDKIMSFGMTDARALAWHTAQKLAYLSFEEQEAAIAHLDQEVSDLGYLIWRPIFPLNIPVILLRWLQHEESVPQVIDLLLSPRFRRLLHIELAEEPPARLLRL